MRKQITEKIQIPEGVICTYSEGKLKCKKDSIELERKIQIPEVEIKVEGKETVLGCKKGNKTHYKIIKSNVAHIKNMFKGVNEKFVYELEVCNVHFPISLKVEGNNLIINNFFGEKVPRNAEIQPNVEVEIKGKNITISSSNREAAGQTAANFEKATKVKGRDKRIYQDGIYITKKPRREL